MAAKSAWSALLAGVVLLGIGSAGFAEDASAPAAVVGVQAGSAPVEAVASPASASSQTSAADAKPAVPPLGNCFQSPIKVADDQMDAFLANPASLFDAPDSSRSALSDRVRELAGSDARAIAALGTLAPAADTSRRTAIGAGLGRAAFACSKVNPAYAAAIQSKVADLALPDLTLAFVTATNDMQVAFIGAGASGGGGGAAAGLSGGGLAGPGSAGLGGDDTVPTTVETYTNRGGGVRLSIASGGSNRRSVDCLSCSLIGE